MLGDIVAWWMTRAQAVVLAQDGPQATPGTPSPAAPLDVS